MPTRASSTRRSPFRDQAYNPRNTTSMLIATAIGFPLLVGAVLVAILAIAVFKNELEYKQTRQAITQPKPEPLTDHT